MECSNCLFICEMKYACTWNHEQVTIQQNTLNNCLTIKKLYEHPRQLF